MQNSQTDRYMPPTPMNKYSPSVPISVYRELAAELQSTQAQMETLKSQNQQLVKQNQQLRQEVEKVVQSAQHLQQIVYSLGSVSGVEVPSPRPVTPPEPPNPRTVASPPPPRPAASAPAIEFPPPPQSVEPTPSPYTETLVIEQEDTRSRRTSASEGLSDVSGWLLVVAILLIVLTAFGTGFLIVRPLLKNSR
ncbi:MAG TPA: bZIP transcription factor [Coleofasciculaceae cyanobacterium]|jgi:hypothetical protein